MTRASRSRLAAGIVAAAVAGFAAVPGITAGQDASAAPVIRPVQPRLEAVPLPRLETLEPAVAEQLEEARSRLAQADASGARDRVLSDAYGTLGRILQAYEFFDSAEAAYVNAGRLDAGDIRWRHLLGYLYEQTGRLEEAAAQFLSVRRLQPDHREATVHLGEVYVRLNRLRDAREQFEAVLEIFPAVARHGLGQVALRERRYEEAIDHFEAVLEKVPQASAMHYALAMAHRGLGRLDLAQEHLRRQGPGSVRAADPLVDALPSLVRGERALVMQGRRAYDAGQFESAADAFGRAVRAAPGSATARANLGLALSRLGDAAGAAEQFEAALRLDANNLVSHAGLGLMRAQQRRDGEAAGHLRAAFAQAPDDPAVVRELVAALLRLGRPDDAIEVLETVTSARPDDEGSIVALAILMADRARYRDAVVMLEDANRRVPDRTAIATTLARLLASSPDASVRDGKRAHELAAAVYASTPTPAHAETVALALAELGRCEEAVQWMRRAVADARREQDAAEVGRLEGEAPKYETAPCRPR
jgi:tetratricopeptide (TPR) repeat protein